MKRCAANMLPLGSSCHPKSQSLRPEQQHRETSGQPRSPQGLPKNLSYVLELPTLSLNPKGEMRAATRAGFLYLTGREQRADRISDHRISGQHPARIGHTINHQLRKHRTEHDNSEGKASADEAANAAAHKLSPIRAEHNDQPSNRQTRIHRQVHSQGVQHPEGYRGRYTSQRHKVADVRHLHRTLCNDAGRTGNKNQQQRENRTSYDQESRRQKICESAQGRRFSRTG